MFCFTGLCIYECSNRDRCYTYNLHFQTATIVAYQIYLWTISCFSTSLSVYWTAEYLYVILLGVLSIIYLKCKNY